VAIEQDAGGARVFGGDQSHLAQNAKGTSADVLQVADRAWLRRKESPHN
jgi:hypothetical protein